MWYLKIIFSKIFQIFAKINQMKYSYSCVTPLYIYKRCFLTF